MGLKGARAIFRRYTEVRCRTRQRYEQRMEKVGYGLLKVAHQIFFRKRATGISSCSRYLATVRRAIG